MLFEFNLIISASMIFALFVRSTGKQPKLERVNSILCLVPTEFRLLYSRKRIQPSNAFNNRNKRRHAFLRRIISPSFNRQSLEGFEPTMKESFDVLIDVIGKKASQNNGVVEMNAQFHNLAFDVYLLLNLTDP